MSGSNRWFDELPDKVGLLLAEGKYQDCLTLFRDYQKSKAKDETVSLLVYSIKRLSLGSAIVNTHLAASSLPSEKNSAYPHPSPLD